MSGRRNALRTAAAMLPVALSCSSGIDDLRYQEAVPTPTSGGGGATGGAESGGSSGDSRGGGSGGFVRDAGVGGATGLSDSGAAGAWATGGDDSGGSRDAADEELLRSIAPAPIDTTLAGITAAAWQPARSEFVLLRQNPGALFVLQPRRDAAATVLGPFPLPGGTVAPSALAASDDTVFVFIGNAVHRLTSRGVARGAPVLLDPPPEPPDVTLAHADGVLLIADAAGPAFALADAAASAEPAGSLSELWGARSDGEQFVALHLMGFPSNGVYRITPGVWSAQAGPCTFSFESGRATPAIRGTTVAWVDTSMGNPLLSFATPQGSECRDRRSQPLGSASAVGAVDLLDEDVAVTVASWRATTPRSLDVELRSRSGETLASVEGLTYDGTTIPWLFVGAPPDFALLVTGENPLLFSL